MKHGWKTRRQGRVVTRQAAPVDSTGFPTAAANIEWGRSKLIPMPVETPDNGPIVFDMTEGTC